MFIEERQQEIIEVILYYVDFVIFPMMLNTAKAKISTTTIIAPTGVE